MAGRTRRSFTEEEIQRALVTVAACSGNARKAAGLLAKDGLKISHQVLYRWIRVQHLSSYEQIRTELLPKLQEYAAEQHRQLAEREMEVSLKMIDRLDKEVGEIDARDLPGGIRNLDTGAGIHRDKAQLLSGQPTVRLERSADEVLRALAAKGVAVNQLANRPEPIPLPAGEDG